MKIAYWSNRYIALWHLALLLAPWEQGAREQCIYLTSTQFSYLKMLRKPTSSEQSTNLFLACLECINRNGLSFGLSDWQCAFGWWIIEADHHTGLISSDSFQITTLTARFENSAIVAIKSYIVTFIHVKSIKVTSGFNLRRMKTIHYWRAPRGVKRCAWIH